MEESGLLAEAVSWRLGKLLDIAVPPRAGAVRIRSVEDAWLMSYLAGLRPIRDSDISCLHGDSIRNLGEMVLLDALVFNGDRVARNVQSTEADGGFLVHVMEMDCACVGQPYAFPSLDDKKPMPAKAATMLTGLNLPWTEIPTYAESATIRAEALRFRAAGAELRSQARVRLET